MNNNDQNTSSEGGSESHSTQHVRNFGTNNITYYFNKSSTNVANNQTIISLTGEGSSANNTSNDNTSNHVELVESQVNTAATNNNSTSTTSSNTATTSNSTSPELNNNKRARSRQKNGKRGRPEILDVTSDNEDNGDDDDEPSNNGRLSETQQVYSSIISTNWKNWSHKIDKLGHGDSIIKTISHKYQDNTTWLNVHHIYCQLCSKHLCDNVLPKFDSIVRHIKSKGHQRRFEIAKACCAVKKPPKVQQQIPIAVDTRDNMKKYVDAAHALLHNGIAFNVLELPENPLRVVFEKAFNCTLTRKAVSNAIPACRDAEINRVLKELNECKAKQVSIIFDGTTDGCEILAFAIRFISEKNIICHRLGAIKLLNSSASGQVLSNHIQELLRRYKINDISDEGSVRLAYASRDGASVNSCALRLLNEKEKQKSLTNFELTMQEELQLGNDASGDVNVVAIKLLTEKLKDDNLTSADRSRLQRELLAANVASMSTANLDVVDIQCLAHAINTIGSKIRTPLKDAEKLINYWSSLVGYSQLIRQAFVDRTTKKAKRKSNVRWFADYPVAEQLLNHWDDILDILHSLPNTAMAETRTKFFNLIEVIGEEELHVQLGLMVDAMLPLVTAIHLFEGDGFIAPLVTEIWDTWIVDSPQYSFSTTRSKVKIKVRAQIMEENRRKRYDQVCSDIKIKNARLQKEATKKADDLYLKDMRTYEITLQNLNNSEDGHTKSKRVRKTTDRAQQSGLSNYAPASPTSNLSIAVPIAPDREDEKYQPESIQEEACPLYNNFPIDPDDLPNEDDLEMRSEEELEWLRSESVAVTFTKAKELTENRLKPTLNVMKACRLLNFAYVANEDIDSIKMQCDNFLPYLSYVQKKCAHDLSKKTSMIIDSIKSSAQKYKNAAIAYKKEYDENKYERVKIKHLEYPSPDVLWGFWLKNKEITSWFELARDVAVIPVSSATAERAFSVYTGILSDSQKSSLLDKVEGTLMIRMNHTYRISQEKRNKNITNSTKIILGGRIEAEKEAEKEEEEDYLDNIMARITLDNS